MEPNKERIEMWCRGMESGEYERGRWMLYDGYCYCPLGIACEVYRKATGDGEWGQALTGKAFVCSGCEGFGVCLPPPVAEWYGIDQNPFVDLGFGTSETIIHINDILDFTLPQIAAAVRRTYGLEAQC